MKPASALRPLLASDAARAAGLGLATALANLVTLGFAVVFARLLGTAGYGDLGALISALLTLLIPGSALQVTVARRLSASSSPEAAEVVTRAIPRLALATVAVAVVAVALRRPTAELLGVDDVWGAAAVLPSAALWLVLSAQRGALQGLGEYRLVGVSIVLEAFGRLVFALLLYAAGAGVTGAFVGLPVALIVTALVLQPLLARRLPAADPSRAVGVEGPVAGLLRPTLAPMAALSLIALMQNVDLIVVKHRASASAAGAYAATSLTAKAIIWLAFGLGLYLLPEASRRWSEGEDTRGLLLQVLGLLAAVALPVIAFYAVAGDFVLRAVFGSGYVSGAPYLPWLALAMTFLAFTYLSVQHLLARGRALFIAALAAAAVVEPFLLASFGSDLKGVAISLAALQGALALLVLGLDLRNARSSRAAAGVVPAGR